MSKPIQGNDLVAGVIIGILTGFLAGILLIAFTIGNHQPHHLPIMTRLQNEAGKNRVVEYDPRTNAFTIKPLPRKMCYRPTLGSEGAIVCTKTQVSTVPNVTKYPSK